jgi:hypothetical protein
VRLKALFARHKVLRRKARPLAQTDRKLVRVQKAQLLHLARTVEIVLNPPSKIPSDDIHTALKILRHRYSNYDELSATFQGKPGRDQATRIVHDRINDAFTKHFPELKPAFRLAMRTKAD